MSIIEILVPQPLVPLDELIEYLKKQRANLREAVKAISQFTARDDVTLDDKPCLRRLLCCAVKGVRNLSKKCNELGNRALSFSDPYDLLASEIYKETEALRDTKWEVWRTGEKLDRCANGRERKEILSATLNRLDDVITDIDKNIDRIRNYGVLAKRLRAAARNELLRCLRVVENQAREGVNNNNGSGHIDVESSDAAYREFEYILGGIYEENCRNANKKLEFRILPEKKRRFARRVMFSSPSCDIVVVIEHLAPQKEV